MTVYESNISMPLIAFPVWAYDAAAFEKTSAKQGEKMAAQCEICSLRN